MSLLRAFHATPPFASHFPIYSRLSPSRVRKSTVHVFEAGCPTSACLLHCMHASFHSSSFISKPSPALAQASSQISSRRLQLSMCSFRHPSALAFRACRTQTQAACSRMVFLIPADHVRLRLPCPAVVHEKTKRSVLSSHCARSALRPTSASESAVSFNGSPLCALTLTKAV